MHTFFVVLIWRDFTSAIFETSAGYPREAVTNACDENRRSNPCRAVVTSSGSTMPPRVFGISRGKVRIIE